MRNLGFAYGVAGRRADAVAIAKELESKFSKKRSLAQLVATVYVGLGDKETAFKWLEKALDEKEDLAGIRWTPALDSLQDDPRFGSILARMGLPR